MTDKEVAEYVERIIESASKHELEEGVIAVIPSQSAILPIKKAEATQYLTKKTGAIFVDVPKLDENEKIAIAQLALAVGRRLERFERASKANAGRTIESRKQIAQNAIKKRWSAN